MSCSALSISDYFLQLIKNSDHKVRPSSSSMDSFSRVISIFCLISLARIFFSFSMRSRMRDCWIIFRMENCS